MKIRNLDEILDEIGDFGWTKNDILDNIFLVSLAMMPFLAPFYWRMISGERAYSVCDLWLFSRQYCMNVGNLNTKSKKVETDNKKL